MVSVKAFVHDYALNCYTFDGEQEDYLIGRLIHRYMRGKRVLDLGCGPVVPIMNVFYTEAKEVVAVDRLKANLDFVKNNSHELDAVVQSARKYKHQYLSRKDVNPKIRLVQGDVTKRLNIGRFDSVMQIGCFAALDTVEQFQTAVNHTYSYLKKGGTLLMMNWLDEKGKVKRPYHFNGKVSALEIFEKSMKKAGFKIRELHTTSTLSKETKKLGYTRIIWTIAKK